MQMLEVILLIIILIFTLAMGGVFFVFIDVWKEIEKLWKGESK